MDKRTNNDLLIHVCIFNIIFNLLFVSLFEKDKINIESLFLIVNGEDVKM
jgi:hypothetical protein